MSNKIRTIALVLIIMIMTASTGFAESIFSEIVQVNDSKLVRIATNGSECISASEYYLCSYTGDGWSDAVYIAEKEYTIKDITSLNGVFYMIEYSEKLGKNRFSYSANGFDWILISECSLNQCVGFAYDIDGNILVQCPENTVLPIGFERDSGANSRGQLGNFSVEFEGETINVNTPSAWYTVTGKDGQTTEYKYPSREIALDTSSSIINGVEYMPAYNYCPFYYKVKEDIKYNVQVGNRYYYMPAWGYDSLYKDRLPSIIYVYEDDEDGFLKRDDKGNALVIHSKTPGAIGLDFKYVDGLFYVYCWGPESVKVWKCSSDLNEWTECDEPLETDGIAETIGNNTKICLGANEITVEYEDSLLENPYNNFVESYKSNTPYKIGEYYYTLDDSYFKLSKDGVYYVSYELPEQFRAWGTVVVTEDGDDFVIQSGIYQLRAPKDMVYSKLEEETAESIYVVFNDNLLAFETTPVIEDGSTLVPMRFLFEQMGADVEWNQETQTATATLDNTAVTFAIDDIEAAVNNTPTTMDVPARLINDKTMVPLRFLSEEMGFDVSWDAESRTAIIE